MNIKSIVCGAVMVTGDLNTCSRTSFIAVCADGSSVRGVSNSRMHESCKVDQCVEREVVFVFSGCMRDYVRLCQQTICGSCQSADGWSLTFSAVEKVLRHSRDVTDKQM